MKTYVCAVYRMPHACLLSRRLGLDRLLLGGAIALSPLMLSAGIFDTWHGSITATPNPCRIAVGNINCTVDISWSANSGLYKDTQVRVSIDGGPDTFVGCANSPGGRTTVSWISSGKNYLFKLYAINNCDRTANDKSVLAFVNVTAQFDGTPSNVTGSITASPSPCQIAPGKTSCATDVSWSTQDLPLNWWTQVRVSVNNGPEQLFACSGSDGRASAEWIASNNIYTFKLYAASDCSETSAGLGALSSANVIASCLPPPQLSAKQLQQNILNAFNVKFE